MKDQEWIISVEKKLTSIQKDVEFIKEYMPKYEPGKLKGMIKTNRWVMTVLFGTIGAILGAIITKL